MESHFPPNFRLDYIAVFVEANHPQVRSNALMENFTQGLERFEFMQRHEGHSLSYSGFRIISHQMLSGGLLTQQNITIQGLCNIKWIPSLIWKSLYASPFLVRYVPWLEKLFIISSKPLHLRLKDSSLISSLVQLIFHIHTKQL